MLEALEAAVDGFVDDDVSLMCDSELRETYLALRHNGDRQSCFEARVLAAIHGRGIPSGDGSSSTAAWVQWQTGQRMSEARALLQAGQMGEVLPLTAKAWQLGVISSSAARTICRGIKPKHEAVYAAIEAQLVGCAERRDLQGLDALIRHYQTRADALDDIEPSELNGVHLSQVGNRWALRGDLDHLAGLTVEEALLAATDKPTADDTRGPAKRRADALTRVCRFFLDHEDLPDEGGERPNIDLFFNWDTIRGDRYGAGPLDTPLSPTDISRLLCDARISRIVFGPDRVPLDVGRATYTPSKGLRRAVVARDRHCRFPGCRRRARWSEVHHSTPWELGGETKLDNLVLLCDYHHHLVHKPKWSATFDGITFTVTNPDGRVLGPD
jgi:hypothetical protein